MKLVHLLATSTLFSAWGDRMWNFAVGLYLIKLTPNSLRLAAIYGLVSTLVAIIFAPVIGDWVDKTGRLKVVRVTLILQNLFVILCALTILLLSYKVTSNYSLVLSLQAILIIFGAVANLIGEGARISISKDWVVVVCRHDKDLLARTNALMRRIDLSVAILAPVAVGAFMAIVSNLASVVFICVWNIFSVLVEYSLLLKVYKKLPDLAIKHYNHERELVTKVTESAHESLKDSCNGSDGNYCNVVNEPKIPITGNITKSKLKVNHFNLVRRLQQIVLGWKVYRNQSIILAGISLALLYLTVLGFNAITCGYAYALGLNEFEVSLCYGIAAVFGILGTFLFTFIRKKIGLVKTGLVGFAIEWTMLLLCVISIWSPGSNSVLKRNVVTENDINLTTTTTTTNLTSSYLSNNYNNVTTNINTKIYPTPNNATILFNLHSNVTAKLQKERRDKSYVSIIVFMVGIIMSRTGLWMIDLTVTQLQQENVPEEERGVVSGVQFAFNSILDLLQFALTIAFPLTNQFGILILISVSSVTCASLVYKAFCIHFLRKQRNIARTL